MPTHPLIVEPSVPDFSQHLLRGAHERFLDALAGAGGGFGEEEAL
jgi:hypothetical protein